MSKWKMFRLGLILFVAVSSLFVPLGPQAKPPITWGALGIIFLSIPIGFLLIIGLQAVNPMSAKVWCKPNWDANPLNFKDPVQFLHLGAYVSLGQGVVTLCRLPFAGVPFYPEALVSVVMGSGILLGIQIIRIAFRSKFER
jgi:hypothetical protein